MRIAYILHRFPYLSETFIMREMYWLREQGVQLVILSLLMPKHTVVHKQALELLPYTRYSPFISWDVIKAQLHFLRRSPGRYFRALARAVWQTYREPGVLLRILVLFPRSVYFARLMAELGIEHVHAHFVWLEGIAAGIAADLIDVTFSTHPHAFGLFGRNQRDVRCQLENATQVVTISEYHRDYIAALCPRIDSQDIEIVHCGIDTNHFRPAQNHPGRDPIRILSVGRLIEKKGHEYLIDACARLTERGVDLQCQIVGAGPLRDALQARIDRHGLQDRVVLLGGLGQDQILELYQTSDIFALPCVWAKNGDQDGMPVVLIEAMACELPIVTTSVAGIPDLVHDNETGLIVRQREASGLADAIQRLIDDEGLRQRLGTQARETIVKAFRIQDSTAKMASIFQRVSQRHQRLSDEPAGVQRISNEW